MPKQEVGSTKWLGNKMKAKGLQKLRWYCQMCQKQCRDENGFKCHRMSDGHQRQMQLFVQDPNRFMDDFSQEFEAGFMQLMGHTYRSTRTLANTCYTDFISNRHHTHMNSTIWVTLSNFVQYLGRTHQCKIDKTPKGWYLQYIDNTPEAQMRQKAQQELEQKELKQEVSHESFLAQQVADAGEFQESEFTELQRKEGDAPIKISMSAAAAAAKVAAASAAAMAASKLLGEDVLEQAFGAHSASSGSREKKEGKESGKERKMTVMESVRLEHEEAKRRKIEVEQGPSSSEEGGEPWLAAGLVVKVMHQELAGGKYHRKKGIVEKVRGQFTADVRMTETKDLIRLEQEMLETVIPNVGKRVRIVKGFRKGDYATMRAVDIASFSINVECEDGTLLEGLGYDQVCKVDG